MKFIFLFLAYCLIFANHSYAQNLSKSDLKAAQDLSAKYAVQLFGADCYQENKNLLKIDPKTNRAKMTVENLNRSCACMAGNIIKKYSATDLIDYMTATRGQMPVGIGADVIIDAQRWGFNKDNSEDIAPDSTNLAKIAIMSNDMTERKRCGF